MSQKRGNRDDVPGSLGGSTADAPSVEETWRLLHDLRVHQIELEAQNEELRRAQEALALSRARYVELYDRAPVGHLSLSEPGWILDANLTAASLLGVARSALIGQPLTGFVLDEDQDIYYRSRRQIFDVGVAQTCEMRMMRRDASPFWARLESTVRKDVDGSSICQVVVMDITARRLAEEALRHSEERYRRITEAITDYIFTVRVVDGRAVETRHGPGCVAVTGFTSEELAADPYLWWRMIVDADRSAVEEQAQRLLAGVGASALEHRLVRKDGHVRWVRNTPVPHLDASRRLVSYDGLIQDITERKQAEAERQDVEVQLRQAQKMEAVGQLAGGVAHDFNNALGVILGFTELALARLGPLDPVRHNLDEIVRTVGKSAGLTRRLLAFARRDVVAPRALDLNDAIASLRAILCRLVGEDIALRDSLAEGLWQVRMDPSQLDQIVMNLASNARDAIADTGSITIETSNVTLDETHCRRRQGLEPGEFVRLCVTDSGSGMDQATRERIFEPFFTTKPEGQGTGLGLATVYGAVRQNGGSIDCHSEQGQGTTFTVHLPRLVGDAEQGPREPLSGALRGTETVLVVEDEPLLLEILREGLLHLGYDVLAAGSPGDAILLCETITKEVKVLVSDVVMPAMNGRDLKERLERIKPGLRTVFMSGYAADVVAHRGIVAGDALFIHKPFAIETLAARIREALHG